MKKKLRFLVLLSLALAAAFVLASCTAVNARGNWKTHATNLTATGGTYTFAYTGKSFGNYTSRGIAATVNVNNLTIVKGRANNATVFTVSNIAIFVPHDMVVNTGFTISYTDRDGKTQTPTANPASSGVLYYGDYEATKITARRINFNATLQNVDIKKDLTLSINEFAFTFKLGKAWIKE